AKQPVDLTPDGPVADDDRETIGTGRDPLDRVLVHLLGTARGTSVEGLPKAGALPRPGLDGVDCAEEDRVDGDRCERASDQDVPAFLGKEAVRRRQVADDERELADLRERDRDRERGPE